MKKLNSLYIAQLIFIFMMPVLAWASDISYSLVGIQGYDPVSYFQQGGPVRGSGNYTEYYEGVSYIFSNQENKKTFLANPEKYLPAYGGYCAYGVSVGSKIVSDPLAWRIVDGTLYLNLNSKTQDVWAKNIPGNIKKANINWPKIKGIDPKDL
ncbi:YHS domain protein [Legionella pneumophila]|uniref:YHS domain-containing (seleno)protein n=1 Tax=Legionella TaxID=445 RepID=UPI0013EFA6A1|nr:MULTISPECIES: YHS domain-containing (seleno)protein [Legionella]MCW8398110.1 YHS domain protein [Legionella sp. PATHC038]MCW8431940.1 YHS domain protein [Legionella pneumophila]HCE5342854.1 YHS domain protein [Legionella pneumophila]HCE5352066.1 YHS domain protein [Legionella pneumophila]HCE5361189.1 YHS domain protein [Legionella pneumophila]